MKTFITKISVLALVLGAGLAVSCSESYLDTVPTDSVSSETAVANFKNALGSLNGIAKTMSTQQYMSTQGFCGENAIIRLFENYPSENYNYNEYAPGWADIHNQTMHTERDSKYNYYAWYYYYTLIGQANSIIAHIDASSATDNEKAFVKASALTFRAYSYQKLLNYYCVRWKDSSNGSANGLPLRLDESTGDLAMSTQAEVYNQIYEDCEEAIRLFEESEIDRAAGEVWNTNINVAHAVYARAALTKEDYSTALTHAKAARAGYPLVSGANYNDGFCRPNSEWIFGSFGDATENNWYWSYGTQFACNGYYASNTSNGAGSIAIALTNRIPDNDVRKALFLTPDKFPSYSEDKLGTAFYYLGLTVSGNEYVLLDEALYGEVEEYISSIAVSGFDAPLAAGIYHLGDQLKFYVFDLPGVGYLPFIRSSEMVLIEAEANYFLNKPAEAQAALVELNATTGRTPGYTCTKTGEALFNEIKDYRSLELWGEGFEWSDYKRWKLPISRKSLADGSNAHTAVAIDIPVDAVNNWTWVIPRRETDYNKGLQLGPTSE